MEIAVLVDQNGITAPIQESCTIQVYKQSCNTWEMRRSMPFCLQSAQGLNAMRNYMQKVIAFLGECRTFAGLSVIGLPFFELEKAGFTIWEMSDSALSVLDGILEAEAEATPPPQLNIVMPRPEPREISPGYYSISLKEIQNCNGMVTSKQLLFPLLANKQFQNLEIICTHTPPWLEVKILGGEIEGTIEKLSLNETRVIISG